jgi:16S rRNA (guanine527-N7)-methyltransferase
VGSVEPAPPVAEAVFGERYRAALRYAQLLSVTGVERGLLGPREPARIWSRHLLNCAVVAELIPRDAELVDVGSGAGLPGLAVALARPDVRVALVEPLLRRSRFLDEAVTALDLTDRVRVIRGRAEDGEVRRAVAPTPVVLTRALAPLDRMVRWCLPLLEPGGWLLALKGRRAEEELATHAAVARRAGAVRWDVVSCGLGVVDPATAVIRVQRGGRKATTAR